MIAVDYQLDGTILGEFEPFFGMGSSLLRCKSPFGVVDVGGILCAQLECLPPPKVVRCPQLRRVLCNVLPPAANMTKCIYLLDGVALWANGYVKYYIHDFERKSEVKGNMAETIRIGAHGERDDYSLPCCWINGV